MKTKKTGVIFVISFLILILSACSIKQPTTIEEKQRQPVVECDQACLEGFANRYIDSLVKHDPSSIPLTEDIKFTENGVELSVGDALWATASATAI